MRTIIVSLALLFSLLGSSSPAFASCSCPCHCKGLGDAILASRSRAAYAASYNPIMLQASKDAAWNAGNRWRGYLYAELKSCKAHKRGSR